MIFRELLHIGTISVTFYYRELKWKEYIITYSKLSKIWDVKDCSLVSGWLHIYISMRYI